MSMSDPVGDMLTRIRNAQRARHSFCVAPASKLRENVLGVLKLKALSAATPPNSSAPVSRNCVSS